MAKEIKIEFEKGGVLTATLLEEKAPKSCKLIWDNLPVERNVIHAMLGGHEIFIETFPMPYELDPENETNKVEAGDVLAAAPANARVEGRSTLPEGCTSFAMFYGPGRPRKYGPGGTCDQTTDMNLFGKIKEIETLQNVGKRIRVYGTEKVKVTRKL